MNTAISGIQISSVNMENRKNLGLKAGDTVRVHQKIEDKDKTRIQVFEGLVLARKHGSEPGATFTVRRVIDGIGVEKIFPLYSPLIDKIEIVRRSTVRRSKLYYIREKVAREIRRQMRRMHLLNLASESDIEAKAEREQNVAQDAAQEAEEANTETKPEAPTTKPDTPETEQTDGSASEEIIEENTGEPGEESPKEPEVEEKQANEAKKKS